MATSRQQLGDRGEMAVAKHAPCPNCRQAKHLVPLRRNFECADLICKFCGFLGQVKAVTLADGEEVFPSRIQGAGWRPKQRQILGGIYHGLYLVGFSKKGRLLRIEYVPAHILQATPKLYKPRILGPAAQRAGHPMFDYILSELPEIGRALVYPQNSRSA